MNTVRSMAEETSQTEGARRPEFVTLARWLTVMPDPEVPEQKVRRRFTAEYKLRVLREADACTSGEVGALLRREGLYSSILGKWRSQRDAGIWGGLSPQKRGRKADPDKALRNKNLQLERENERLKKRLKQASAIIAVQKKVSEMLGISLGSEESDGRSE